jgi:hypothetical protein
VRFADVAKATKRGGFQERSAGRRVCITKKKAKIWEINGVEKGKGNGNKINSRHILEITDTDLP